MTQGAISMSQAKPDMSQFLSDRFKFEKVGDAISGTLTNIAVKNGLSGDVLVLTLRDRTGADVEIWCPSMLARLVAEADPEIGTGLTATLTGFKNTGRPQPM